MRNTRDRLYGLLPAIYRRRDEETGQPLRALLRVIEDSVDVVENNITQLSDNWFIETCEDWVVPYIGDLIGYDFAHESDENATLQQQRRSRLIPRRDVANTIRYRRRKGALALLELLSHDVAGWPARVVEFGCLLGATQSVKHVNLQRGKTVDLRETHDLDVLNGPFDRHSHTIDLRCEGFQRETGRYNLPNVGLFIWRLKPYPVTRTPAYCMEEVGDHCYTFSVLGSNTELYTNPQRESSPTQIAAEINLPAPIRRSAFEKGKRKDGHSDGKANPAYYGAGKSVVIWAKWGKHDLERPIPPEYIISADLSTWLYRPPADHVAVDTQLGRIAFSPNQRPEEVLVSYYYGFSADIGGGEYQRQFPMPSRYSLSQFQVGDFKDLTGLISKLKHASDAVSQYLTAQLSVPTRELIATYQTPGAESQLLRALIADLNKLLLDETLYDRTGFSKVMVPAKVLPFIDQNLDGGQRAYLNRSLLEATYPREIGLSDAFYRVGPKEELHSINEALARWTIDQPRHAVIEITESALFQEQMTIHLAQEQTLTIQAGLETRPIIRLLDWQANRPDALSISGETGSRFSLDGLLISGRGLEVKGELSEITIRHTTLVPGWAVHDDCEPMRPTEPSIELYNAGSRVRIEHSIIGSMAINDDAKSGKPFIINISDSIIDATSHDRIAVGAPDHVAAHAILTLRRTTVLGQVHAHAIELAENCIFTGMVQVARRQVGCMRFCYVPAGSRTPRRYNCQPDKAKAELSKPEQDEAEIRIHPQFNSVRYGNAAYCQLSEMCAGDITHGADDESEMGVFHDLYQPQRSSNLRTRLNEYVPADKDVSMIYVT